jgi:hypothetical protein
MSTRPVSAATVMVRDWLPIRMTNVAALSGTPYMARMIQSGHSDERITRQVRTKNLAAARHHRLPTGQLQVGGDAPGCAVDAVERDGVSEARNDYGGENADDRDHQHQFDQREGAWEGAGGMPCASPERSHHHSLTSRETFLWLDRQAMLVTCERRAGN